MPVVQVPNIIDIEASGFGPQGYPIEIGFVLSGGRRFCSLIKPLADWTHWSEDAAQVHKIDRETLYVHGREVRDVCEEMNTLLKGSTLYSDGWVVDKPWIDKLFFGARMPMRFFVSPLELILNERQMERWQLTRDRIVRESNLARHRASNDAWIIQETYIQSRDAQSVLKRYPHP